MPNFSIFPFNVRHNRKALTAAEERALIVSVDSRGRGFSSRRWHGLKEVGDSVIDETPRRRPAMKLPQPPEETTR